MFKVLIIKLRYIGDTLTLLPVVRSIKMNRPEAHVSVMIYEGTEGILAYQKEIDNIILLDRNAIKSGSLFKRIHHNLRTYKEIYRRNFDLVVDLTSSDRSSFIAFASRAPIRIGSPLKNLLERFAYHQLIEEDPRRMHIIEYQLASLKKLGFLIPEPDTNIFVPEETIRKVRERWAPGTLRRPFIIIHPGARMPLRRWREERFAQITDRFIHTYQAHILLIGGAGEENILHRVENHMTQKLGGKVTGLPLIEVAALLRQAQLFIGNDTGTGHIAAGVGIPHIILFGPTFPHIWRPRGGKGISISKSPDCCGCRQITCLKEENPCMDWIGVEEVWQAVRTLI